MRVISLGSGSSGNAFYVQAGEMAVLVDAGLPERTLISRLRQAGVAPSTVRAVVLTHEHADHTCGAVRFARQQRVPLVGDARTLDAICRQATQRGEDAIVERAPLPVGRALQLDGLEVRSFATSHDAVAPCGYLIASQAWRVCIVTDTGMVTEPALEALRTAHLVVLETNHDRMRLLDGPYPQHLKLRILSPTGHLSNEQAGVALDRMLDEGPRWLWLAHLSKTNNTPDLARAYITERLRARGWRHIQPLPLPRELGPVWDSAALWRDAHHPAPQPAAPAAIRVREAR